MTPVLPDALPDPILKSLNIASMELRAGVLVAQHKLRAAKKLYANAEKQEKKLGYHEPPFYIRPVAETEAAALLKAKDYKDAEAAYEAALVARPNSGFGLYGLALREGIGRRCSGSACGVRSVSQSVAQGRCELAGGRPRSEDRGNRRAGFALSFVSLSSVLS